MAPANNSAPDLVLPPLVKVKVKLSVILLLVLVTAESFAAVLVHQIALQRGLSVPTLIPLELLVMVGAAIALLSIIIHEGGHVIGFFLVGLKWHTATIGIRPSVYAVGSRNHYQQTLISGLGPLCQLAYGAGMVLVSPPWSMLAVIGWFTLVDGTCNLLIPLGRGSDAAKLYWSLGQCLIGRGKVILTEHTPSPEDISTYDLAEENLPPLIKEPS